jgi:hypothetical protein
MSREARRAEARHALGALLMWSGIGLAVGGWIAFSRARPAVGAALFALALVAAVCGAILKKRYCPKCRKGACPAPERKPAGRD